MADISGPPCLIRSATGSDLPALLALFHHLPPDDARPVAHQAPDQAPDQAISILTQLAALPGSACALIENIVTQAAHRAEGHGTALLNAACTAACTAAWQAGCDKVMLLTGSDAPATHAFYQGAGFTALKTGCRMRRLPARPQP